MTARTTSGAVSVVTREIAARLAAMFERDSQLAGQLNDAHSRLQGANRQLWSGLHPDALALIYDNTQAVAIPADGQIRSRVSAVMLDELRSSADEQQLEVAVLAVLQEIHWTIHRAFVDYQSASEQRRQLAVDVGERAQQLTDVLTAAGWTEREARNADVNELAAGSGGDDPR